MSFFKKHSLSLVASAGLLGSLGVCMAFLFMVSLLAYREVIAGDMSSLAAYLSSGIGVFCCTFFTAKLRGRQALPLGLSVGSGFLLVCLVVNLGIGGTGTDWAWFLKQGAVCIGSGLLGALLCAGKNPHTRRHKKRR